MSGRTAPLRPLTDRQRRCAALIGAGKTKTEAAREVSRSRRSIATWCQRSDFQALMQAARDQALSREPTAAETLRAALLATKSDGSPDWEVRVRAASVLTTGSKGEPSREPVARPIIFSDYLLNDDRPGAGINSNGA